MIPSAGDAEIIASAVEPQSDEFIEAAGLFLFLETGRGR